jgi:hypothetical protein|tara:strand:+ start:6225 stop:6719 length:495 start_codon:yes stop_codon:yes gene_type:complete
MRKLLVVLFFVTILFSCKNNENEYKNNLIQFKNLIEDINTYFIDSKLDSLQISHYYTEDFVFHSYPAGHKKGVKTSKVDYINNFNQKKNMNMSINITHSIYLPGINEESHDIDGSVRVYYGATISNDTIDVEFSGYQTINFSEGKISGIWEWADYGGVSNQFTK